MTVVDQFIVCGLQMQVFGIFVPVICGITCSFCVSRHVTPMTQIGIAGSCVDSLTPDDKLVFMPFVWQQLGSSVQLFSGPCRS